MFHWSLLCFLYSYNYIYKLSLIPIFSLFNPFTTLLLTYLQICSIFINLKSISLKFSTYLFSYLPLPISPFSLPPVETSTLPLEYYFYLLNLLLSLFPLFDIFLFSFFIDINTFIESKILADRYFQT